MENQRLLLGSQCPGTSCPPLAQDRLAMHSPGKSYRHKSPEDGSCPKHKHTHTRRHTHTSLRAPKSGNSFNNSLKWKKLIMYLYSRPTTGVFDHSHLDKKSSGRMSWVLGQPLLSCNTFCEFEKQGSPFPGGASGEESTCQGRRPRRCGFNLWVRKIPGGGRGNPLQYSCLENPMDRGAWQAAVPGVAKSQTWLKQHSTHTCTFLSSRTSSHEDKMRQYIWKSFER